MSRRRVLTVNAGSSSVKLRLIDSDDEVTESIDVDFDPEAGSITEIVEAVGTMGGADIVAHRLVHGGEQFRRATLVDADVAGRLQQLIPLAPLHLGSALALLEAVGAARPGTQAVACFDTAFHATMPRAASTYAIPELWRREFGIRRYGFHGLSHDYASQRGCELLDRQRDCTRVVVCHLGAGASVCAVSNGRSIDTSMGFTPLEGLVMATRSGTIDPAAVLWMIEQAGLLPSAVHHALEHESGLLALAGTADMRVVTDRANNGDDRCTEALEIYVHRLRAGVAAMAAAMNGVDIVVFTGGIGEHSPDVRRLLCLGLAHLGVALDSEANAAATGDAIISPTGAKAACVVVTAREDLTMARAARSALEG